MAERRKVQRLLPNHKTLPLLQHLLNLKITNMKKYNLLNLVSLLLLISLTFSSCQAIMDIFKTGFWAGVIVVVVIIIIIAWLFGRSKNN